MLDFVPKGNLAQFSTQESQMLKGSIDFLGINYYTANYVTNAPKLDSEEAYYRDQQIAFFSKFLHNLLKQRLIQTTLV